jgi:hypothetical protein
VERCVEVMVGVVERRREGWSRIRRVFWLLDGEEAAWMRIFVIFCSRQVMVGGVGRRDSESRSRKWNWGEREMSRACFYLLVSTFVRCTGGSISMGFFGCLGLVAECDIHPKLVLNISNDHRKKMSTYRSSSKLVFPKGEIAHPAH